MELALESVLQQRSRQLASRLDRKRSVMLSAALHVFLMSSLILVPILMRRDPEPIEFTPITIVPVQALGVENAVSPPARNQAPPSPSPNPPHRPENWRLSQSSRSSLTRGDTHQEAHRSDDAGP